MNRDLIKLIRANLQLSQNDFARRIGVNRSEIGLIEAGYRDVSDKVVKAIRDNVDPGFIELIKAVYKYKRETPAI